LLEKVLIAVSLMTLMGWPLVDTRSKTRTRLAVMALMIHEMTEAFSRQQLNLESHLE
jgi:hypothetical protein